MKIQNTPPMCSFLSDLTVLSIINGYNAFLSFINLQTKFNGKTPIKFLFKVINYYVFDNS